MTYAIEMYFDKETEDKIMSLSNKIADSSLSTKFLEWKTRPHVTLAVFNDVDENKCIDLMKQFVKGKKAIPAFLSGVGMFTDTKVIYLNPSMKKCMYELHAELHEIFKDFDVKGWEWYQPDGWVPHCTIALNSEDKEEVFYKTSELVLREFKKMSGEYTGIGLVKITFPVEEIATVYFESD